jgi:MYXO-CTERM domain-containing protein
MIALLAGSALTIAARDARAFPTGDQFDLDPLAEDGAGGIAFDGAPRWAGHTCAVCHTGAPGRVTLRLEGDRPELFTDGWRPTQQYHLRVVLNDTWAGEANRAAGDNCGFATMPYRPCDQNGFALELVDAHGTPVGTLAPFVANACAAATTMSPDADVRISNDHASVTHKGAHMGQTAWDLCWTAPGAGAGVITAYLAAVDGNGGDGTLAFPTDNLGDDVASGAVPLPEVGVDPVGQTGGCSTAASDDQLGLGALIVALALVLATRRRRLVAIVALAALVGCTHVQAHQRGTLAKRNMQFAPDPTEDELDLHMQQSREGSSGGYGSSGGGCGCN